MATNSVRFRSLIEVMVSRYKVRFLEFSWYYEQSDSMERQLFKNKNKQLTMHHLITLPYRMRCAITGTVIEKGEQAYYNYETKNCILPSEYEKGMSQAKIGDAKTYFQRLSKLNTKNLK